METVIIVSLITTAGTVIVALIALLPRWIDARQKRQTSTPDTLSPSPGDRAREATPIPEELPDGHIRLFGTSASDARAPREMDLSREGEEIRIDIHNPGSSQWVFWVRREDFEMSLRGWDWHRAAEVRIAARKASSSLEVVLKLYTSGDAELELQAGKWWMWLKAEEFAQGLLALGVRLDRE